MSKKTNTKVHVNLNCKINVITPVHRRTRGAEELVNLLWKRCQRTLNYNVWKSTPQSQAGDSIKLQLKREFR